MLSSNTVLAHFHWSVISNRLFLLKHLQPSISFVPPLPCLPIFPFSGFLSTPALSFTFLVSLVWMVIDDKNGHWHLYFPRESEMGSPQKMVIPFLLSIYIVYVDHININKARKLKLADCTLLCFINPEKTGINSPLRGENCPWKSRTPKYTCISVRFKSKLNTSVFILASVRLTNKNNSFSEWNYNEYKKVKCFIKLLPSSLQLWVSLAAQTVKHLPAMRETWVQSLGQEDPWRRKWQPTLVLLPGQSHRQRRLMGYSPWGHKELYTTEVTLLSLSFPQGVGYTFWHGTNPMATFTLTKFWKH